MKFFEVNHIRNIGIAGHIDHGKTTLADHILAEAGIVPRELAGKARYLDYLLEEQRRGITIKTSVISFVVQYKSQRYLINLCDTPGHVDFSGKVSRAFRLVDGVLIIVDAVEGVMAQTEAYLRLALKEVVKPIVFINKIDRLIRELKEPEHAVFSRIASIVKRINEIISQHAPKEFRNQWFIKTDGTNLLLGSAIDAWGAPPSELIHKNMRFRDIIKIYENNETKKLAELFPLGKNLVNAIINAVPPPNIAQKYRTKYLWKGEYPENITNAIRNGPTVFYVSKVSIERGRIFAICRTFGGISESTEYYCLNDNSKRRANGIFLLQGANKKSIPSAPAGYIFGTYLKAQPGQTFASVRIPGHFHEPYYFAYPVLAVAVEPEDYSQIRELMSLLDLLKIEDPNMRFELSQETGRILIFGIGELHLETILNAISEKIKIYHTKPTVAFKETILEKIQFVSDSFEIVIEPKINENLLTRNLDNTIIIENLPASKAESIRKIIEESLKHGPKIGEPIVAIKIKIVAKEKFDETHLYTQLGQILAQLKTAILQPFYKYELITNCKYLSLLINELSRRNATINAIEQEEEICQIKGHISVLDSIGIYDTIRSQSHGHASIQLEYLGYRVVRKNEEPKIFEYLKRISTPKNNL